MRNLLKLAAIGLLVLFISAFTSPINNSAGTNSPSVYKIMEVTHLWDLLASNYAPDRERDGTWLDVGLRSKYAKAKKYASISVMEETFGEKVFIRGPHQDGMDFNSATSFGYYNPQFIAKVKDALAIALENPAFSKVAEVVYEKHLQSMAHTYQDAFAHVQQNTEMRQNLINEYLLMVAQPEGALNGSLQEKFRAYAEALESGPDRANIYEAFTAPSFWIRRHIDGTADDFNSLLEMTINHFEGDK